MNAVFKKMNYKNQQLVHVMNAPLSFEKELSEMVELATFKKQLKPVDKADFIIVFCTKQEEIDKITPVCDKALQGDGLLWFAYPKGTSKKYTCDFNRDNGWNILGKYGFEPVRQIAIDEDWSALRFRRVAYIKTMTRGFAMSKEGKIKVRQQK